MIDPYPSFEEDGPELVRLKLSNRQYNDLISQQAVQWLADHERRSSRKRSASKRIQLTLEIIAATAATIGAVAAIIAAYSSYSG